MFLGAERLSVMTGRLGKDQPDIIPFFMFLWQALQEK